MVDIKSTRLEDYQKELKKEIQGEVFFDKPTLGRYSTDASIYQIEPLAVVVPKTCEDVRAIIDIARSYRVPILPRGAGTSQCGQTVGRAIVVDNSKHLNKVLSVDIDNKLITVEPGVVLDRLNQTLRPYDLWFPVDISTSAQATVGGMAGNNSCGSRSIRYGNMVHNVESVDAHLSSGKRFNFGPIDPTGSGVLPASKTWSAIEAVIKTNKEEIQKRWPKVLRRVQGYNLDMIEPGAPYNAAHLLVGSEGTLGFFSSLTLKLSDLPSMIVLASCQFSSFYDAMEKTQEIVALSPDAVELIDRTMIDLARQNESFAKVIPSFIEGRPDAILLVEFSGADRATLQTKLKNLSDLLEPKGVRVTPIVDTNLQKNIWAVRRAGLNIMMSMKGDGKPVSFIEDCAVPLEHLAEYTKRLDAVFMKHNTRGTWYAHASVGTLHVRPILDMRQDGAKKMRAIAEEACAMVQEFKGAFSGEHGDGLVRSEWIEPIIGPQLTKVLESVKKILDPIGIFNPGKIVNPPRMDDSSLFRYRPSYQKYTKDTFLDWSEYGGFLPAVEMCNNNGHCRKVDSGVMCPTFRATGDEQFLTRGRANTLRLMLSKQFGENQAYTTDVVTTVKSCLGCKGCRTECPTGVDMSKIRAEFLFQHHKVARRRLRDRVFACLPLYVSKASRFRLVVNWLSSRILVRRLLQKTLGVVPEKPLPVLARPYRAPSEGKLLATKDKQVALFVDTFSRYFNPENIYAAKKLFEEAGYQVLEIESLSRSRPICCGRTFFSGGYLDEAKYEADNVIQATEVFVKRGVPIVGLEPSCLSMFKHEFLDLGFGEKAKRLGRNVFGFSEFLYREIKAGRFGLSFKADGKSFFHHRHCHQESGAEVSRYLLSIISGAQIKESNGGCCGQAGSFGYEEEHTNISRTLAAQSGFGDSKILGNATPVSEGFSCRCQMQFFLAKESLHISKVLEDALERGRS